MDFQGDNQHRQARPWPRPQPDPNHRVSTISDVTLIDNAHPSTEPLRGRESMVSIGTSYHDEPPYHHDAYGRTTADRPQPTRGWASYLSQGSSSGSYSPLESGASAAIPLNTYGSGNSEARRNLSHGTIPEEDYDLGLLSRAAPMGHLNSRYETLPKDEPPEPVVVDISSMAGPSAFQNDPFFQSLQAQEAEGQLTGGLGAGFKPQATMTTQQLLASSPTSPTMRRTFSFSRRNSARLDRRATLKNLGQDEANRQNKVIEVIIEDDEETEALKQVPQSTTVDLSVIAGTVRPQPTFATKRSEIYYPQGNWKPVAMRWPFLVFLILLSCGLAISSEFLYRVSAKRPLLSFHMPQELPPAQYIAVKFAPTVLAVIYGVFWQIVDIEVKRLEAFYQLSKEGGALAAESINVDYTTSFSWLRPFRAFRLKHWAVFYSSIGTVLGISIVPTLSAASVVMAPNLEQRLKDPNGLKTILIHAVFSRLLTATLSICAIIGIILLIILSRRRSGLLADVRGIAGLASMAVVSHILVDFAGLDHVPHRDIHAKLKYHRYILRDASLAPDSDNPISSQHQDRYLDDHLPKNPHPFTLRAKGFIPFFVFIVLFSSFIVAFLFTPAKIVADKAPIVVTGLAVCVKLCWICMETDIRMMEPYYILYRRHAPSSTLMLDYTAVVFGYLPIRAFLDGRYLVAAVGIGSVMAEFLTILATGLATNQSTTDFRRVFNIPEKGRKQPPSGGEANSGTDTEMTFVIFFFCAMFILIYMLVVLTIVFFRRRTPFLPRQPNTIASVLAYIHQSNMIYNFKDTSKFSNKQMARHLKGLDHQYGLGWFRGRDGQMHCGVDHEELLNGYKHGEDYSLRNQPWDRRWDSYD
ncbi:hypothetical protein F5X68DRAFT_4423 [Plectosphaerella plurivora]|uniref:Uncharacterized protein n=1 Tax=Plectosphaerella plurivora TaxID=936078 RepID=A0A9P8VKV1_9PEZI|nr:hypothetical protein F5X68DRAFT_4423 [Plectosphaerella plurivora]